MNSLEILKALADATRLQITGLLVKQPYCVEDLAELTGLAVSTVSAHMKKMHAAGLVYVKKQQYYSIYHLKKEVLEMKLEALIPQKQNDEEERLHQWKQKVLKTYSEDGVIKRLPTQNKKRWVVYMEIIKLFEFHRTYTEKEVNELITTIYHDYCFIRRELIDEGVLRRENGIYEMVDRYWEHPGFYQKIWNSGLPGQS